MSDYFTQFSCIFHVGTAENAARAENIRDELATDLYREEGGYPGFELEVDHEYGPGARWTTATSTASLSMSSPSCAAAPKRLISKVSGGSPGH